MSPDAAQRKTLQTSKNAALLLLGTVTRMAATFAFLLYSTRALGLDGFGKYSVTMYYFELALSLCATGIGIMLTRDIARWSRNAEQLTSGAIVLTCLLSIASPLVLLPWGMLLRYSPDTLLAMAVGCLALLPSSLGMVLEAVFVAKERAAMVTVGTAIESLLRIALSFLVLWLGYGLIELMYVLLATRIVQLAVYVSFLRHAWGWRWKWQGDMFRRVVYRWRVFAAENWMATINNSLEVMVLSFVSGETAVGIYSAAQKLIRLGSVVARSFTTAVYPVMSRMYVDSKDSFYRLFRNTVRIKCMIALPICMGTTVLADRIIALLYSEDYASAGPVLQISIWVLLLTFMNPFLSHVLFAQGRQHHSMIVAAISLAVSSVVAYGLISYLGAVGAAISCVFGGYVAMMCYLAFAIPKREIASTIGIFARVMAAALGMGGVTYLLRTSSWFSVIAASAVVYLAMLVIVQALRLNDIRFFRSTFLGRAAT